MKKLKDFLMLGMFGVVYYAIHLLFLWNMDKDSSASLEYVILYFPLFWIISGVCLVLLIVLMKIPINTWKRILLVFLLTPFPFISYLLINSITSPPPPETGYVYYNGEQKYRTTTYRYRNGKIEREEIYKKSGHFDWYKDSIWTYYNKKGEVVKKEGYMKDSLIYIHQGD